MSNLPKNFEKILLGVAGVAAVGFAAWGYLTYSGADSQFSAAPKGAGNKETNIPEAPEVTKAVNSLKSDRTVEQSVISGGDVDGRPVDLFVGVPLFANKNDPNTPVDPYKGAPLFPPIPNKWWLDNGADMTWANSPDRDDDHDGFSNKEEWEAKTSPTNDQEVPPLLDKLAYIQDKSTMWYVKYNYDSEGQTWSPTFVAITPDKKRVQNRVSADGALKPGDTFFPTGEFAKRFKFTGFVQKKVVSPRTQLEEDVTVAQYEDLKSNKAGTQYESRRIPDAELEANAYYDRIAIIELRAQGNEGKHFEVEEGTKFALPPGGQAEKNYLMKKVTPTSITVEYTKDGKTETREIPKGGTH